MFQTEVVEKIKTHILCSVNSVENLAFCDLRWKDFVEQGTSQMAISYGACAMHAG